MILLLWRQATWRLVITYVVGLHSLKSRVEENPTSIASDANEIRLYTVINSQIPIHYVLYRKQVAHRLEANKASYEGFDGVGVQGMSRIILPYLYAYQVGSWATIEKITSHNYA